jgi:anthranilate synthase/aminodeoxychorismate synthase-like glutamine amidotransferase
LKIVLVDNYDSFSYILYDYLCQTGALVSVVRNDTDAETLSSNYTPDKILISPGPGHPTEAGISAEVIKRFAGRIPILGVCLGHQVMGLLYGYEIKKSKYPKHGKVSLIKNNGEGVFSGLPERFEVMRYHSLYIHPAIPANGFKVTAVTDDGIIMGIRNEELMLEGVQFHPESVLTAYGKEMINNWVKEGA